MFNMSKVEYLKFSKEWRWIKPYGDAYDSEASDTSVTIHYTEWDDPRNPIPCKKTFRFSDIDTFSWSQDMSRILFVMDNGKMYKFNYRNAFEFNKVLDQVIHRVGQRAIFNCIYLQRDHRFR